MKSEIKITEHQLQTLLMNYLTAKGWYVQRMNSGMIETKKGHRVRMSQVGTPDIMAFRQSQCDDSCAKLVFVEVKTPQNPKPTFAQEQKMRELEEHGARCLVVHSLEELQDLL